MHDTKVHFERVICNYKTINVSRFIKIYTGLK